jgi:hypothetical protein
MSDHVGAITANTLLMLVNNEVNTERALKEMFVLFETLVYLPQSGDTEGADFATEVIAMHATSSNAERRELLSNRAFTAAVVDAEDVWSRKELMRFIAETLLNRKTKELVSDAMDQKLSQVSDVPLPGLEMFPEFYRSPRGILKRMFMSPLLWTDIDFAELVRKKFRFGSGMLSESHKWLLEIVAETKTRTGLRPGGTDADMALMPTAILDQFTMPDFGSLTWGEIFDLRTDRFVNNFRAKIGETMRLTSTGDAKIATLEAQVEAALWQLAKESQPPRVADRLGKIGLSLLQVPLYEWVDSLLELREDAKRRKTFGWLYFLANARDNSQETRSPLR